ncbi:hypothetical protein [Ralstonia pseudosolanacearum]|uniref:Uncharacterized protein n=2 Tax=Ralstonia solanacearum species complex TaxID=3116862 RepID=A0A0S4VA50_RALSL|nr:hypothetical protein [Ralstonia pseudosolanacearum]CUV31338.1 protein of unknown function [Ralstonia solanacearum]MCK4135732.1 hypothetical protein [Ralstonia pseudosolanacearum]MCK4145569.1 hypothetical protein [Ralstonia pseudosolanacearum]MDK1383671.1 hypothetical protein [Ralstonia pseudosolanacearum]RAA04658.1 hypothetical protein DOT79_26645 [Ralstonia pseudosolanacearum]
MNKKGDDLKHIDHVLPRRIGSAGRETWWVVVRAYENKRFDVIATTDTRTVHVQMKTWSRSKFAKGALDSLRVEVGHQLSPDEHKIEIAPGFRLHRLLGHICPPAFRERELDALHADALALYLEKLAAGDKWGALSVKWAMRGWLLWTVFGGAVSAFVSILTGKQKSSK